MEAFHERLIAEKDELDAKIKKLAELFESEKANEIEDKQLMLLRIQYHAMTTYSSCLTERLGLLQ